MAGKIKKSLNGKKAPRDSDDKNNVNDTAVKKNDEEDEMNSGFSSYLKSVSGMNTLRMFVIVNSLVMFLTVAWPQIKLCAEIVRDIFFETFEGVE